MSEVTRILTAIDDGDPFAADELLPLVYDKLRKLAAARLTREKPGGTIQATALVHEAYLRLVGVSKDAPWQNHGHFGLRLKRATQSLGIAQRTAERQWTFGPGSTTSCAGTMKQRAPDAFDEKMQN